MQITWFGHSAFRLEFGKNVVLIDPFFTGNPAFKSDKAAAMKGTTHIVLTHGHSDHIGDAVAIAKSTGAKVVSNFEICMWLADQGVEKIDPMNLGGTTSQGDFTVSFVRADHSSGQVVDGDSIYLGNPAGAIITANGEPTVYHLGDTDIFSDMQLIAEIYKPKVAIIPIGDRFTMGPKLAALALKRFLKVETAIPCHYASFPPLEKNADAFVAEMKGSSTKVVVPENGKAVTV